MKPLFTIFICMLIGSHVFGQIKKVILSHSQLQPRWVVECDSETEENCTLRVYFPNGRTKATLKIFYHNKKDAFRPNGDGVVYHSNGTIYQDYDHETGILRTYYPTGELEAKMVTPINEGTEYKYSYFKNGQIWEEEVSKRQPGEQNLQFGHSQQRDYFYDNRGYSYTFLKKYHSNGNLAEHSFLEGEGLQAKYVYLFFFA